MIKLGILSIFVFATVGCSSASGGGAAQRSIYRTAVGVAPAPVITQRPMVVSWVLKDELVEASDVAVSKSALEPIVGVHLEAGAELPAPVARVAAKLAIKEGIDGIFVMDYTLTGIWDEGSDSGAPPDSWTVSLRARKMALITHDDGDAIGSAPGPVPTPAAKTGK
jgi:hypothetical protein